MYYTIQGGLLYYTGEGVYNYTLQGNCNILYRGGVCLNYAGGCAYTRGGGRCKYTIKRGLFTVQCVHKTRRSKLTWSETVNFDGQKKKGKKDQLI